MAEMDKIKALVVDDEEKSCKTLSTLLTEFCENVEVVGMAQTLDEAEVIINNSQPDVVFLDIQMKNETGFDLFGRDIGRDFNVVFTTAYSEYAIKAIKVSALDYLLKPIDVEELQSALDKVRLAMKSKLSSEHKLEQLLKLLEYPISSGNKIALPTRNGLHFVSTSEIYYCQGQSNYTEVYTAEKKYTVSRTLKEVENMLDPRQFARIHKSFIVNLNEVKDYIKGEGGQVVLKNNVVLDIAKRRKDDFLKRIFRL